MYKLYKNSEGVLWVFRPSDNTSIPMHESNADYREFKKQILAGAELQDADGNVMTQEQADDFIKELP